MSTQEPPTSDETDGEPPETGWGAALRAGLEHARYHGVQRPVEWLRPRLPKGSRLRYQGYLVDRFGRWGDTLFRMLGADVPGDRPSYESSLVDGLHRFTREGDRVVIVGGGWGVTAAIAAEQVGSSGSVTVFEGSGPMVRRIRETLRLNEVETPVEVHHAVVGPDVGVYGEGGRGDLVSPEDLPECDVLQLDCEGSELEILENLRVRPSTVLVESHGYQDAPPSQVRSLLEGLGYTVVSQEVAEADQRAWCEERGIHVLVARRTPEP